jgi:integrase
MARWRSTTLAVSDRKAATIEQYTLLARKHIESAPIGAIGLDKLRPSDVEALILSMRTKMKPGRRTGDDDTDPEPVRAYSDSTIRTVYTVLRLALDGAVRDGQLARNPAAVVRRPGVARQEAHHLEPDDVVSVLQAAQGSRNYTALALIAATGIRRGEALALRWDRVDLKAGVMRIEATLARIGGRLVSTEPKTERSRRTVPLPPAVVVLLRTHRTTQLEERLHAGNQWTETGLVFTTEFGTPVDPRNLLRTMQTAASAAGVNDAVVHTLRHSAASAWLESGVHIKAVSDMLGHSSIAITADTYGHTGDDTARAAVDGLAGSPRALSFATATAVGQLSTL